MSDLGNALGRYFAVRAAALILGCVAAGAFAMALVIWFVRQSL